MPVVSLDRRVGFGERLVAFLIDLLAIWAVDTALYVLLSLLLGQRGADAVGGPLLLIVGLAYFIYPWARTGQTPGHRAMGLRVVSVDGSPLTFGQAIVRYIGYWVSAIPVGLGFLWVFEPEKQGWHDKMAGTCVVRWPEPKTKTSGAQGRTGQ
jgi:uncharacterized RDD family membrane protein YckC